MFNPTKTWRRWHRRVNTDQKRFAVASALAASAIPALVFARGHRIDQIAEVPLVVSNESFKAADKTKDALALLTTLKAHTDVEASKEARRLRSGKGKMRNRRYLSRRGPLLVHNENTAPRGFRNLPGVEVAHVSRLNLLDLAPGGHLGRFIIWTASAFSQLDAMYGSFEHAGSKGYRLPQAKMTSTDLSRIISSDEIQKFLRPIKKQTRSAPVKSNPLKNVKALLKLNPYAEVTRRAGIVGQKRKAPEAEVKAAKAKRKAIRNRRKDYVKNLLAQ